LTLKAILSYMFVAFVDDVTYLVRESVSRQQYLVELITSDEHTPTWFVAHRHISTQNYRITSTISPQWHVYVGRHYHAKSHNIQTALQTSPDLVL